ncbi:hypothetical protein [Subtercola sp. RTI3]|uniref:hypothetical protein n=1 Tax=Subtercola sp. RTI3 TaxID=3048639 RepID=UPI002B2350FF|nr:hypothetical protein [Subtercola sp. RTI3]MEA9987183.1 hypothetical protein [Subtercola sp. RTI3]
MTPKATRVTRRMLVATSLGALTLAAALAAGLVPAAAFAADDPSIGITVTTVPVAPGAAAAGTASAGSAGSGSGTGTGSGAGSVGNGSTVVTPTAHPSAAPVAKAGEFDLGGLIFISGVSSEYSWSINPLAGEQHALFTVHNVSSTTIDSTATFSIVGPFGNMIGGPQTVAIAGLKPDETRLIDATLTGLGQWSFFTTHATFTPPATVQGTALSPLTRDGFMFVLPWFLLVLVIVALGASSVVRIVRGAGEESTDAGAPEPVGATGLTA